MDTANVAALASGRGRLVLVCRDLAAALADVPPGSLAGVSVSNVPDWLTDPEEVLLARAVRRAAAPGAPVIVRRVAGVGHQDPFIAEGFVRDPASAGLVARERTALYETVDLLRAPG